MPPAVAAGGFDVCRHDGAAEMLPHRVVKVSVRHGDVVGMLRVSEGHPRCVERHSWTQRSEEGVGPLSQPDAGSRDLIEFLLQDIHIDPYAAERPIAPTMTEKRRIRSHVHYPVDRSETIGRMPSRPCDVIAWRPAWIRRRARRSSRPSLRPVRK